MALKGLAPILSTVDMDRSIRLYVAVLGFKCGVQMHANLCCDAVRIVLAAPSAHLDWNGPRFTGQLYIELETAEAVDALWEMVKDRAKGDVPPLTI